MINIDDFAKVEMKVGTILEVEEIEGSEKLWKLTVDLGNVILNDNEGSDAPAAQILDSSASPQNDNKDIRQVLSGIKQFYTKEELIGRQAIFVANLQPRQMMGLESQAMIMASEGEDRPILLAPSEKVANGSKVR